MTATIDPSAVVQLADWWLARCRAIRTKHARRKGHRQREERRADLVTAIQGTHDANSHMRSARIAARRAGDRALLAELEERSLALQRERRYLRRMLGYTR